MGPSLFPAPRRGPGVLEESARGRGARVIIGTDEAGRGCLAGPVTAAAVAISVELTIPGLDDSKVLSPAARAALEPEIRRVALAWAVTETSAAEVDRTNVLRASLDAMARAVREVRCRLEGVPASELLVLVDGPHGIPGFAGCPLRAVVDGDALSVAVAAASVLAKVHRDRGMEALAATFPGYGWERNRGYGTPEHLAALRRLGPTPQHRRTFAPVAAALRAS